MSVLKDAAAAIYGSRAANGVILITTKRGKEGKATVQFTGSYGFSKATQLPKMCNAYEYATMDSNPYLGREPRFYADLGFDGSVWGRKRAADGYALDPTPLGNLQTGTYELSSGGKAVSVTLPDGTVKSFNGTFGCDTRKGPIEDWNGSFTSYYEKKLIDTKIDAANVNQVCPYPYFRLSDMARHTFATEICLSNGMPASLLAGLASAAMASSTLVVSLLAFVSL